MDMCATSHPGGMTLLERCTEAHFLSLILPPDHEHFQAIWRVCQQRLDRWRAQFTTLKERLPDLHLRAASWRLAGKVTMKQFHVLLCPPADA
jgi:hypothetical protein